MYSLMKSEKLTLDHVNSGPIPSYRQIEVGRFEQFDAAQQACDVANDEGKFRHYVVNESGQEYYEGIWID